MLKVLELYCGIGGLHYALEEIKLPNEVIAAVDINTVTNRIYEYNFPDTPVFNRSIESLTAKELDKLSPDLIHMSPPCQPFVRVGKQQDRDDQRTKSFLHLIGVIPKMTQPPKYIFLENVKGFDTSETRMFFLDMLKAGGYRYQEFLLNPMQFGIPNSRLRYYLIGKLENLQFDFTIQEQVWTELPPAAECYLVHKKQPIGYSVDLQISSHGKDTSNNTRLIQSGQTSEGDRTSALSTSETTMNNSISMNNCFTTSDEFRSNLQDISRVSSSSGSNELGEMEASDDDLRPLYMKCQDLCHCVGHYLEEGPPEYLKMFMIPPKFLRHFWVMDIVKPQSKNSCCFTKRYGHYMDGAGSVIQTAESCVDMSQYKQKQVYHDELDKRVQSLKLRFFTPREIANLMCFPKHFEFPPDISTIQCYRALGNSLNVHVVAVLLQLLLFENNTTS